MPRGRPKKPILLRKLEGDKRKIGAKKHADLVEKALITKRGRPTCPAGLDPVAKKHWEYLCDSLHREKLLAEMDGGSLVAAATAYSAMMNAHKKGNVRDWDAACQRYIQISDRLGLTESARAKFTKKPDPVDALDAALCG